MEFKKSRWNLKELLKGPDTKDYKKLVSDIKKYTRLIEKSKKDISSNISPKRFFEIIKYSENLTYLTSKLGAYGSLWFSEDTNLPKAKAFMSKCDQLGIDISNRTLFFDIWFKSLDDKTANKLIMGVPEDYRYHLKLVRLTRKYILSEKEEKIINIKDVTGVNALDKIYDIITNKFVFNLKIKGKALSINREQLQEYVRNKDAKIRKAAYDELLNVFSRESETLSEIYRSTVLDIKNEAIDLRGYKSPISMRNLGNDLPDKVVDILLKTCQENVDIFQKYFRLKAKILGLGKMYRHDIYAPIKEKKMNIPYDKGVNLVFDSYDRFSPLMGKLARNIFIKKHIDSEVREYKKSGAFCLSPTPDIVPYVLSSYNNNIDSVDALAHELGHAVHSQLSSKHNIFAYGATLPLAETASTFGERLLYDYLADKYKSLKSSLIIKQLDNYYANIPRQAYFTLFEKEAHKLIADNKTSTDLNNAYFNNLKEQFGNSLIISPNFKYEWIAIPHIYHSPFYCYSYSFGTLLVLSLYDRYKKEGKDFVNDYIKILSAGGSDSPKNILKATGINIEERKFWQSGFNIIKGLVRDLSSL